MNSQEPKRHHYNSKGYLQNFFKKGRSEIAFFDKENQFNPFQEKPLKSIGFEIDFYSFINIDDEIDRSAETEVFGLIDNDISKVFKKIRDLKIGEITNEEYGVLSQFIALQWLRGPKPRHDLTTYLNARGVNLPKEAIRQVWLLNALKVAPEMIEFINKLPSTFIVSPEGTPFITSDAPCISEVDLKNQNIQRFVPLSSRVGLLMMDGEESQFYIKVANAKKEHVQILNERVASNALRYIFGESEAVLRANGIDINSRANDTPY